MNKKITTDKLAGMVQRGFADAGQQMQRGFEANERNFSEFGQVMQAMLKQLDAISRRLDKIDEKLETLVEVKALKERVAKLERKIGV